RALNHTLREPCLINEQITDSLECLVYRNPGRCEKKHVVALADVTFHDVADHICFSGPGRAPEEQDLAGQRLLDRDPLPCVQPDGPPTTHPATWVVLTAAPGFAATANPARRPATNRIITTSRRLEALGHARHSSRIPPPKPHDTYGLPQVDIGDQPHLAVRQS